MKTLIIDNYDSFTNNLFQLIASINGEVPIVIKNDLLDFAEIKAMGFDNIIISPGPGHPNKSLDFGVCSQILLESLVPVLGVCLGHQGLACAYGGVVRHALEPIHGRVSQIEHNNNSLFANIPQKFNAVRYHSLIVDENTLPDCLEITARSSDGSIMGIAHKYKPLWGVQYHPESINTDFGYQLLKNFIDITRDRSKNIHKATKSNLESSKIDVAVKKYKLLIKQLNKFYNPEHAFLHLYSSRDNVVWLDSSLISPGFSRFSFMGCLDGPHSYKIKYDVSSKTITHIKNGFETLYNIDIFDYLKNEIKKYSVDFDCLPFNFKCGFVGYFGYELYSQTLAINCSHQSEHPDAQFLFLDRVIVFDNEDKKCYLLSLRDDEIDIDEETWFKDIEKSLIESQKTQINLDIESEGQLDESLVSYERCKVQYIDDIKKSLDYIKDGESYEICLTNRFVYAGRVSPYEYYSFLRAINPAPYSAFLNFGDMAICSASIERFLLIDKYGNVETKPIKGTLPRGSCDEEDLYLIEKLKNDEKFKSENLMIVDLLRHDLGGVCQIGSVYVEKLMAVETYSSLHQLVSTIKGKLCLNKTSIDCINSVFPGGSMTGAPKLRTVGIINKLEHSARGIYSGAIGYLSLDGAVDLNIVIRTAVITPKKLSVGIGGAIIALSDPKEEYLETLLKLKSLKKALNLAIK